MNHMSQAQKDRIVQILQDRGATLPCPRCGNQSFTLLEGYFSQPVQSEPTIYSIGGAAVPSVVIACTRCGYMSQHALGALGLLNEQVEEAVR